MKLTALTLVAMLTASAFADNEITASATLSANKGYYAYSEAITAAFNLTNAAPVAAAGTINVTTSPATISFGSVGLPGWSYARNLSTTNNMLVVFTARLQPGEFILGPASTNAITVTLEAAATNEATSVFKYLILGR